MMIWNQDAFMLSAQALVKLIAQWLSRVLPLPH
jgi:hypothetical protein